MTPTLLSPADARKSIFLLLRAMNHRPNCRGCQNVYMRLLYASHVNAVPMILRIHGYRIGFYQADLVEPPHVHVRKQEGHAKFWMTPVEVAVSRGFASHEISEIRSILEEFRETILAAWRDQEGLAAWRDQEGKRGDRSSENPGQ